MAKNGIPANEQRQFSTTAGEPGHANLIYVLFLAGLVTSGVTALVGVVMAYIAREDGDETVRSHYANQISIFWKTLVFVAAGFILMIVAIGFLILLAAAVWYIVRIVKGMTALSKNAVAPEPDRWGL